MACKGRVQGHFNASPCSFEAISAVGRGGGHEGGAVLSVLPAWTASPLSAAGGDTRGRNVSVGKEWTCTEEATGWQRVCEGLGAFHRGRATEMPGRVARLGATPVHRTHASSLCSWWSEDRCNPTRMELREEWELLPGYLDTGACGLTTTCSSYLPTTPMQNNH